MVTKDSNKTIVESAKSFFSGTAISRGTGLIREIVMAAAFGTAPAVAAFWMAYRFSQLLRRIFGEGALNAAFIPHFESLRKEDAAKGSRFFYDLSLGLALLLLLLALFSEGILGSCLLFANLSEANTQVVRLTMLMLPALVFISLYALNTSLLNCEKKFFLPSVAPSFLNLIWVGTVLFLWGKPINQALERLSIMIVLAFAMQWAVTVPHVYAFLKKELGSQWWREKKIYTKDLLTLLRPFFLTILGVTATQINTALDAIFARIGDPEGPAYLWYALRIQQLPLALFGLGVTGALLPPISRAFRNQDYVQYQKFISFAFKQTILFMIPVTFGIFALGFSGVHLIYGHGEFTQEAVLKTTRCLWAYGIGLFPMTSVLILASSFYAQKKYKIPTFFSLLSIGLNILLNSLFVFLFKLGPLSIALATSFTALINCTLLSQVLKKKQVTLFKGLGIFFAKVLMSSMIAFCSTFLLGYFFLQDETINGWVSISTPFFFSKKFSSQMWHFIAQIACFGTSFIGCAFLLKIRELREFLPFRFQKEHLPEN